MKINLPLLSVLFSLLSCENSDGLFGHSKSKAEAKANGSNVIEFLPNKSVFKLLDSTEMKVDTAWTEISFTYKNGKQVLDSSYGYNFTIQVKNDSLNNFTFNFKLLDTTNRMFTNAGPGEDGLCQLHPKILYDDMKVILEQKNRDTSKGWMDPINTDTITFRRIRHL